MAEKTAESTIPRLSEDGTPNTKAALNYHIRLWLKIAKEHDKVPSHVAECVFRILVHFTTAQKAEEAWKMQTPSTATESDKWMARLRVLFDDNADDRLLRHLQQLPERLITRDELLSPNIEGLDHPPAKSSACEQSEREIREIMRSDDRERMKDKREVFYVTGPVAWTVRPPYWPVALATDSQGNRFLSDDVLDRALPKWRRILNGERLPMAKHRTIAEPLSAWLAAEQQKASSLGKPWPQVAPSSTVVSESTPKTVVSGKK